ncbi:MAG TPA: hypothetical protein VFK79_01550 [Xanthobacteraceae bacterium]|nr:hypothetical protein [Xanthobacteraceae bacterium]
MQSNRRCRRLFLASSLAGGLILGCAGGIPAKAKTPFDGPWAVVIMTEKGSCDPAYRYAVVVADGNVSYDARESSGLIAISGKVDGRGQVAVNLRRAEQQANASGRLSQNGGTGTWAGTSSTAVCSGRWEAKRN